MIARASELPDAFFLFQFALAAIISKRTGRGLYLNKYGKASPSKKKASQTL